MIREIIQYLWDSAIGLYFLHIHPKLLPVYESCKPWLKASQRYVGIALILYLIIAVCLSMSFLQFGVFYFYHMPRISHTFPVYFEFNRACIEDHRNFIASHDEKRMPSSFYDNCKPEALVLLTDQQTNKPILTPDQNYQVKLKLDVPETQRNLDAGMFMVTMSTADAKSSKPASLKHSSILVKLMKLLSWWPLYLFGFLEERQAVEVGLFDNFIVKSTCDTSSTFAAKEAAKIVQKQREAALKNMRSTLLHHRSEAPMDQLTQEWNGLYCDAAHVTLDLPDLQIYSAQLEASAAFTGFQYVLYKWPTLSFIFGTMFVFMIVMTLVVTVLIFITWKYELRWWMTNGEASATYVDNSRRNVLEDEEEESNGDDLNEDTNSVATTHSSIEIVSLPMDPVEDSTLPLDEAADVNLTGNIRRRR